MADDLALTLGRQESAVLEFKREAPHMDTLRQIVCALANDLTGTGGGDLLIGVDKTGRPFPTSTEDDALLRYLGVRNDGDLLPRPSMSVSVETYAGSPVVRVHVNASDLPPVRLNGVAWIRPGPQTRRANGSDERILLERRTRAHATFDARGLVGVPVDALDLELLRSTYLSAAVDPEVVEENDRPVQQQMASLGLVDERGCATTVGLLLGGFDPTAWLPGAYVQFVRYAGTDVGADVADEEEVRDNLITATRTLTSLVQAAIVSRPEQNGPLTERTVHAYPVAAVREVLMNAIMHRTYESSNAPVRLQWFDDRLEISSPGGPYGTVTAANYDRTNDYRNPALAAAMKTLGLVNRFGRGIGRTKRLMADNGSPPPVFEIDDASWTVTLETRR